MISLHMSDETPNMNRHDVTKAWLAATRQRTRSRCDDLLRRVDFDPAEVMMVGALWINIIHRLFWKAWHHSPMVYSPMTMVIGGEALTGVLLLLGIMGLMAFLLFLPNLRRNIDLAIATYFVTNGVVLLLVVHDSLLALQSILIFGTAGYWTFWRQGKADDRRGHD
jgi:hypothetical protein